MPNHSNTEHVIEGKMILQKQTKDGSVSVVLPKQIVVKAFGWAVGDRLFYKIEEPNTITIYKGEGK